MGENKDQIYIDTLIDLKNAYLEIKKMVEKGFTEISIYHKKLASFKREALRHLTEDLGFRIEIEDEKIVVNDIFGCIFFSSNDKSYWKIPFIEKCIEFFLG